MPSDPNDTVLDPAHVDEPGQSSVVAGRPDPDPAPTVTEDGNLLKHGGRTYVREEALHEARQAHQKLSKTLSQLEPLMPDFEEFLAQKQGRQAATVARAAPVSDDEYSADELEGMAIVRGYYKPDATTPDLDRARQELNLMARIADRRTAKAVQPVADANIRDRAAANHQAARTRQFLDGDAVADPKYIDAVFDSLPEKDRADPFIANLSVVIAAGLQSLDQRRQGKGRRSGEPTFREGASRLDDVAASLDELDRAAARARGKTPEQWAKLQKQTGGGRATTGTVLEEI